jgi:hypothetical protein
MGPRALAEVRRGDVSTDADIRGAGGSQKSDDADLRRRTAQPFASGSELAGGRAADGGVTQDDTTRGPTARREHPLHSDGVVCRCAVHWRRETIARGLDRLFAEDEEASEP